jgi:two-component system response regulator (stage 0 sporulation protein F)
LNNDSETKILIIDDQEGIRQLLREVFKDSGYSIFTAANGKEALEIASSEKPQLAMLDMKLPGMNGIQILEQLKKTNPDLKVIMMTAYGDAQTVNKAIGLGAICCMFKPFDIFEVKSRVNEILLERQHDCCLS